MTLKPLVKVRPMQSEDENALIRLFTQTVRRINAIDYTPEQIAAWAPDPPDLQRWKMVFQPPVQTYIIEIANKMAGFGQIAPDGYLNCFYVHANFQRQGVGSRLMKRLLEQAHVWQLNRLYADVSLTAHPFFKTFGFEVVTRQTVQVRGVEMDNFQMEKLLYPTEVAVQP